MRRLVTRVILGMSCAISCVVDGQTVGIEYAHQNAQLARSFAGLIESSKA